MEDVNKEGRSLVTSFISPLPSSLLTFPALPSPSPLSAHPPAPPSSSPLSAHPPRPPLIFPAFRSSSPPSPHLSRSSLIFSALPSFPPLSLLPLSTPFISLPRSLVPSFTPTLISHHSLTPRSPSFPHLPASPFSDSLFVSSLHPYLNFVPAHALSPSHPPLDSLIFSILPLPPPPSPPPPLPPLPPPPPHHPHHPFTS
ncbi:unnamed protein product [Closterium sp. Naga37s-1]|nr:unnamed protein product [Closterium sp. Naga37s-1]